MPLPDPYVVAGPHDGSAPYAAGSISVIQGHWTRHGGANTNQNLVVRVLQANGSAAAGEIVTLTFPASGPSAAWNSAGDRITTVTTDSAGYAGWTYIYRNSTLGQYSATAVPQSNTGLVATVTLENVTSSASIVGVAYPIGEYNLALNFGQTDGVGLNASFFSANEFGTALTSFAITYQMVNPPAGTVFTVNSSTSYNGLTGGTRPRVKAGNVAGSFTIKAYKQGTAGVAEPFAAWYYTISDPNIPSGIDVQSGNGQSTAVNTPFGAALAVLVTNNVGTALVGASVTFTAPATGPSCSFSGSNVQVVATNASGIATSVVPVAGSSTGSYSVAVTCTGTPGTSFSLTNSTPAAPQDRNDGLTYCET